MDPPQTSARGAATTCPAGGPSTNTTVSQTSTPSLSTSSSRVATSRCHHRSGRPVRSSANRMNSGPSDPTARGCGTVINRGHVASLGTRRSAFSHGTSHRSSAASSPSRSGSGSDNRRQPPVRRRRPVTPAVLRPRVAATGRRPHGPDPTAPPDGSARHRALHLPRRNLRPPKARLPCVGAIAPLRRRQRRPGRHRLKGDNFPADAARQECAERHFADEAHAHRLGQQRVELVEILPLVMPGRRFR